MRFFIVLICILVSCQSAFAEGIRGWTTFIYTNTNEYQDKEKVSETTNFGRNFSLGIDKFITPALSYQLYLRGYLLDTKQDRTDTGLTKDYRRSIEPSLDIYLRNPIYDFNMGYKRLESWTTAHLVDSSRRTNENYYARFNLMPYDLPSFNLQYDGRKLYDHLPKREIDTTTDRYAISSTYTYNFKDLILYYNFDYSRNITESPIGIIAETTSDSFNTIYSISYSKSFLNNRIFISTAYQGNYIRGKTIIVGRSAGEILIERNPVQGLYGGPGTLSEPDVKNLDKVISTLIDSFYNVKVTVSGNDINIGNNGQEFHNIGMKLPISGSVDRLDVYAIANNNSPGTIKWRVYKTDLMDGINPWTQVSEQNITPTCDPDITDPSKFICKYSINVSPAQSALFFKVVNMSKALSNDVLVSEIEAFGVFVLPGAGEFTSTSDLLTQGLSLSSDVRIRDDLSMNIFYSISRNDENPAGFYEPVKGIFTSLFSKYLKEDEGIRTTTSRLYGTSVTWLTHRLLTTNIRLYRAESFDNKKDADLSSNTYSLNLVSIPIPELNTGLLLMRTDSFSFGERSSINYFTNLSINAKIYKDFIRMNNDIGYTQTKTFETETKTSTKGVRGGLDIIFTKDLFANIGYSINWSESEGRISRTRDASALVTFRPGRFINLIGNFRISESDKKDITTSEGISINWLPLPVIGIDLNVTHTRSESEKSDTYNINNTIKWYVKRFLNLQFTYNYLRSEMGRISEIHRLGLQLVANFW